MPPIVSHVADHHSVHHPELQRTYAVLRPSFDRAGDNNNDFNRQAQQHQKVIGSHLMLSKQSSTPAGHPALSSNANFLSISVNPANKIGLMTNGGPAEALLAQPGIDPNFLNAGLHRRLDRSHSEPVWPQQQQQQPDNRPGSNSSRYKTELCRPFEENGFCKYGDKCQFAHGGVELRTLNRHPKYKTELCRTFHTIGICPYGPRCHFIHNAEESRVVSPIMAAMPMSGPLPSPLQMTNSPPPALVPSPHNIPLAINSPMTPLPTIFDKNSPPSSVNGGSPTSGGVFFDDTFSLFQGHLLEGLAESLAQSLHLNNKQINYSGNFSTALSTNCSNSTSSGSVSPVTCSPPGGEGLNDHPTLDTPPASPPDPSCTNGDDSSANNALRLPIFQSMNPLQQ